MSGLTLQLYLAINAVRKQRRLRECSVDPNLEEAAQSHSTDMWLNNFVSHIGSNGSTFIQRVRLTGRYGDPSGEIICKGPGGINCISAVVKGWLDSPGHRDIMLDKNQFYFGAGINLKTKEIKGNYWVVVFAYE